MTKHGRAAERRHKEQRRPPPPDRRQAGLQAFQAGRFDQAIAAWAALPQRDAPLTAALAEAHFRHALQQAAPEQRVASLQRAIDLAPADLRYQHHLGLALHQAGDLPAARRCYEAVLQADAAWPGAALALALAALEQDPSVELAKLPGYGPAVEQALAPVQALCQGSPPGALSDAPLDRLWYGLGLLQAGDGAARPVLDDERDVPSPDATAVRRYYQGLAAAQANDQAAALAAWWPLFEGGAPRPWLVENLAATAPQHLFAQLAAGDVAGAAGTARRLLPLVAGNAALAQVVVPALDRAAHDAAEKGDWQGAAALWEEARQVVSGSSSLGSPQPLQHNLALAYEALERWPEAATAWRALLRTRPRSRAGGATEVGPSDAQWSWVRRRVIECYQRAGTPAEAVIVYRQALKAEPDDLELRLQLADALLANEQEQAARNELGRLLERAPQHVEARLRLAKLDAAQGNWDVAAQALRQLLQEQPEREDVRRQLVQVLLEAGQYQHVELEQRAEATLLFEAGRQLAPQDYRFPLNLARLAIDARHTRQAEELLEQALALGHDQAAAYTAVIQCFAALDDMTRVRAELKRAEAAFPSAVSFYLNTGIVLLSRGRGTALSLLGLAAAPEQSPWTDLAIELLDRAVALRPTSADIPGTIASELLKTRPDLALPYAAAAARLMPNEPQAQSLLGLLQGLNGQEREGKESLRRAARLARQQGDEELAAHFDTARSMVGDPMLHMMLRLGSLFGDLDEDVLDAFF